MIYKKDKKGLTPEKKLILKELMGSCSGKVDLGMLLDIKREEERKMSKPFIELITCESGDWKVLRIKKDDIDVDYQGHSIGDYIWLETMRDYFGCDIEMRIIRDEDMEEGNY